MLPVVWSVWILCALFLVIMHLYRSRLTRDEEDQIFLDESSNHQQSAQTAISDKVHRVEPIVKTATWLTAAATLLVVVYYIYDIFFVQFK